MFGPEKTMFRTPSNCLAMVLVSQVTGLLLLLAMSSTDSLAAPRDGPWLKIGYVSDLTGRGAFFGVQSHRGAILAQQTPFENSGRETRVLFEDTSGETKLAANATRKLLNIDKVDALMCDITPICAVVSPFAEEANIPLIYLSPSVKIAEKNKSAYRNFIDYESGCRQVAEYWKKRSVASVASLIPNLEFGELCYSGFEQIFPGHFSYRYNPGDDLRAAITQLKSHNTQGVIHVGYEADFLSMFKISNDLGYRPSFGFAEIMMSEVLIKSANELLDRGVIFGYRDISQPFLNRLIPLVPEKDRVNLQGAALAYNGIAALVEAFLRCDNNRTLECLNYALRSLKIDGQMGFKGWQNGPLDSYPIQLKKWSNTRLQSIDD